MKRTILVFSLLIGSLFVFASGGDKPAYKVFTSKGKSADYEDLVKAARSSSLIFFGELHDNSLCHWLELQLTKDLANIKGKSLILGAEMFETDNQLLLNEYVLRQIIRKKDFDAEAKLWKNYQTDYSPIVEFARQNRIKFVATSIPRRFAAIVNLKGFEGLDNIMANERGLMAPLPIPYDSSLNCYKNIMAAVKGAPHMGDNLAKAQAMKDATMAYFMLKNVLVDSNIFLHFNGSYHSEYHEGIVWMAKQYLRKGNTDPKILTIACVEQKEIAELDTANAAKADFIIVIPADMTKTYYSDPGMMAPSKPSADAKKEKETRPKPKEESKDSVIDNDNE